MEEKHVTKEIIEEHERQLGKCLVQVDAAAKAAEDASTKAKRAAERSKQIEEETKALLASRVAQ